MRLASALAVFALAGVTGVGACNSEHPLPASNTVYGGGPDAGTTGRSQDCSSPGHEGCPCSEEGATGDCGQVAAGSGSYVTCSMGHSRCDGKAWGACVGNRIVAASLPGMGLGIGGLHPLSTGT